MKKIIITMLSLATLTVMVGVLVGLQGQAAEVITQPHVSQIEKPPTDEAEEAAKTALLALARALRDNDAPAVLNLMPPSYQRGWKLLNEITLSLMTAKQRQGMDDIWLSLRSPGFAVIDRSRLALMDELISPLGDYVKGPDSAEIRQVLAAFSEWAQKSPAAADPLLSTKAGAALAAAASSFGVTDSAGWLAISGEERLARLGQCFKNIKVVAAVYGFDFDAILTDVTITEMQGTGDARIATIRSSVLGNRDFHISLKKIDNTWIPYVSSEWNFFVTAAIPVVIMSGGVPRSLPTDPQ